MCGLLQCWQELWNCKSVGLNGCLDSWTGTAAALTSQIKKTGGSNGGLFPSPPTPSILLFRIYFFSSLLLPGSIRKWVYKKPVSTLLSVREVRLAGGGKLGEKLDGEWAPRGCTHLAPLYCHFLLLLLFILSLCFNVSEFAVTLGSSSNLYFNCTFNYSLLPFISPEQQKTFSWVHAWHCRVKDLKKKKKQPSFPCIFEPYFIHSTQKSHGFKTVCIIVRESERE